MFVNTFLKKYFFTSGKLLKNNLQFPKFFYKKFPRIIKYEGKSKKYITYNKILLRAPVSLRSSRVILTFLKLSWRNFDFSLSSIAFHITIKPEAYL